MAIPSIVLSIAELYHTADINLVECSPITISKQKKSTTKHCFSNAGIYIKAHQADSLYCLGYYLMQGDIPIEHAWVKSKDQYLDITLETALDGDRYFSFFQFDWTNLFECFKKYKNTYPTLYEAVKFSKSTKKTLDSSI